MKKQLVSISVEQAFISNNNKMFFIKLPISRRIKTLPGFFPRSRSCRVHCFPASIHNSITIDVVLLEHLYTVRI